MFIIFPIRESDIYELNLYYTFCYLQVENLNLVK